MSGVVTGARRPPVTCPESVPRKRARRVLTASEARVALQRAWEDVTLVSDWLRAMHPVAFVACRLSVRMTYSALLVIDRVVGTLE